MREGLCSCFLFSFVLHRCLYIFSCGCYIRIGKDAIWLDVLVLLPLSLFDVAFVRHNITLPRPTYVASGGGHTSAHHDSTARDDTTGAWAQEPGTKSDKLLRAAEDLWTVPRGR